MAETTIHPAKAVARILAEARTQLGMSVAFVSQFTGTHRVFRFIDGDVRSMQLQVDNGDPLEETYCQRILDGTAPNLIHDAQTEPSVADIAATKELNVGAHISVPIVFSDGRLYGTFCCFSQRPDDTLDQHHVALVRAMADLAAEQLEREELSDETRRLATERVRAVLEEGSLAMTYQPIVDLVDHRLVGVEALARFEAEPRRSPDQWFEDGWTAGLGPDLELTAADQAAAHLSSLPEGVYLSINISPETALSPALIAFLEATDASRIVLELTEHSHILDYLPLRRALDDARASGVRIAIDDVGTGYAGLQHLLELQVDILKLDVSITQGLDTDPVRHSLAGAIASVGDAMGLTVVAEGIETKEELQALQDLGFLTGQGYYLGRPAPPEDLEPRER